MTRVRLLAVAGLLAGVAAVITVLNRPSGVSRSNEPDLPASLAGSTDTARQNASRAVTSLQSPATRKLPDPGRTALLGSVVAPIQATLSVRMPSRIRDVLAKEGDTIRAGQTLVELDRTEFTTQEQTAIAGQSGARAQVARARAGLAAQQVKADADVAAARSGLRQAQAKLQQALLARQAATDEQKADLKAALEAQHKAEVGLDRARDTLRSLEDLARVGGVSRSDLEGARVQQRLAQSDLESAKAQVERVQAGSGGLPYRIALAEKDVDSAQAGVEQARDGVRTAEAARRQAIKVAEQDVNASQAALVQSAIGVAGARSAGAQTRLASPIAGLVTSVMARKGETAQPGAPLATVVSLTGLRVDALVPARLLSLFHIDQRAGVTADTAPGRIFQAVVSEIARIAEPDGRTFRVKFRLLDSPPLRPGQTARISVQTGEQTLPRSNK